MEFQACSCVCSESATSASTLFPVCGWFPQGLSAAEIFGKLFLQFFEPRIAWAAQIPENAQPGSFDPGCARELSTISQRHGRGAGVGRGLGVGIDLGVGVGLGVDVAVAVAVAVGVAVGVDVAVAVAVGDAVGV